MTNHRGVIEATAAEVRAEMARQRKTARELAGVLGVTPHTAARRLSGAVEFGVADLVAISAWLNVDTAVLMPKTAAA